MSSETRRYAAIRLAASTSSLSQVVDDDGGDDDGDDDDDGEREVDRKLFDVNA